ncbi:hypothetical protein Pryu01_03043 [Paraliobacillus ryukyuensis]|uniref:Uncharacterized protein n=1 Tax=Paraliobacillus ryukyuensis TaxID=200904 RepID=A0A366DSN7_9BACI|nr:hypothetical protein [Paraliobacillus ryukyuensis]RBO92274.1 hypothetical protein DES48_11512 [Paraliobacillus ryukyuensis]
MIRRTTEHKAVNTERDQLIVFTVYEQGTKKEQIKQENIFTKKHGKVVF